jgi:hypothetical protein
VLVVGSGGREHALAWKLAQSPDCEALFCAPGSPGTAAEPGVQNVALDVSDNKAVGRQPFFVSASDWLAPPYSRRAERRSQRPARRRAGPMSGLRAPHPSHGPAGRCPQTVQNGVVGPNQVVDFCKREGIGLVMVGPEAPLVAGLVDDLAAEGVRAFGPSAAAAQLEGSKKFMKVRGGGSSSAGVQEVLRATTPPDCRALQRRRRWRRPGGRCLSCGMGAAQPTGRASAGRTRGSWPVKPPARAAQDICKKYNIPTAAYETFTDPGAARLGVLARALGVQRTQVRLLKPEGRLTQASRAAKPRRDAAAPAPPPCPPVRPQPRPRRTSAPRARPSW